MYADVSIVVDGALEETETFHDYALMDNYVATITEEAEGHGYRTEIFVQYHDHDLDDDGCECAQYEQDHHPYAVINGETV